MATPPAEFSLLGLDISHFKKSDSKAWRGPCPFCGGTDRFVIFDYRPWPHWWVQCNQCAAKGWIDQVFPGRMANSVPAPEMQKRRQMAARIQSIEANRKAMALARYSHDQRAIEYHANLDAEARRLWSLAGVPPDWQDYYLLGITTRIVTSDEAQYSLQAMTIPIVNYAGSLVNCQYRFVAPPPEIGRYRQEPGLPAAVFIADLERREAEQAVIVEGSKKAMVLRIFSHRPVQVYGIPGATSYGRVLDYMDKHKRVTIMLDPGARLQATNLAARIGSKAVIMWLDDKPDDYILKGGDIDSWLDAQ